MRRLLSLVLIVFSGWMLYRSAELFHPLSSMSLIENATRAISNPDFLFPFVGALLGLLGGLSIFLGGTGGATIAFCGGILAAGFALASGQTLDIPDLRFWDNEIAVGIAMIAIATWAAITRSSDA